MEFDLNLRIGDAHEFLEPIADELRISTLELPLGGSLVDFGVRETGGIEAGLELARLCMADLGQASLVPGELDGSGWPHVQVVTDAPVAACLLSQYAGWQIAVGDFFGMGSGPMRAAAAREELFEKLDYHERDVDDVVGILECSTLPDDAVFDHLAEKIGIDRAGITLLVARTASQAGNVQVVARSVETALHKLFELGFDVRRVQSGFGTAPLPPVAADDLTGIGRTNDAILYGGRVTLWVTGDDESLGEIGPRVPADSSDAYGKPFLEIFEEAGRDFYAIDPSLFSPAQIVFQNLETGRVHRFGRVAHEILVTSFGL
jgi:methenyltetrahydromethanopterin cyclohydrolase